MMNNPHTNYECAYQQLVPIFPIPYFCPDFDHDQLWYIGFYYSFCQGISVSIIIISFRVFWILVAISVYFHIRIHIFYCIFIDLGIVGFVGCIVGSLLYRICLYYWLFELGGCISIQYLVGYLGVGIFTSDDLSILIVFSNFGIISEEPDLIFVGIIYSSFLFVIQV